MRSKSCTSTDRTATTTATTPQFKKRFLREASILARLQHPNIVTVFDYGAIEGLEAERYFMAMEFLSGQTLTRRISDNMSLATRDTMKIARQIARGLSEAHAVGVIHRDLKPSNVMLLPGRDGEDLVKIVDFGIVKLIGDDSRDGEELTQEGSFIGSPKYMAPEQITRGGKIDARTDVYSFGIILYQCLTGSVPFDGASSIQTLMAHLNQVPQPIRERAPSAEVPEWLDLLVMSCVEKDPEKRPQTMEAVARALAEAEAAPTSSQIDPRGVAALRSSSPAVTRPSDSQVVDRPLRDTARAAHSSRAGSRPRERSRRSRPNRSRGARPRTDAHLARDEAEGERAGKRSPAATRSRGALGALPRSARDHRLSATRAPAAPGDTGRVVPPVAPLRSGAPPTHEFALRIESIPSGRRRARRGPRPRDDAARAPDRQ